MAADRGAAALADRALTRELQREAGLAAPPDVDIRGVPFLTQALRGRYERVDVTARDVPAGEVQGTEVRLQTLTATLRGARVPLSAVLSGTVAAVPVDRVDAEAEVPYDVFARSSGGRRLTVSQDGDRLRVRGQVRVLGRRLSGEAISRLSLDDDVLLVTPEAFDVGGELADRLVTRALGDRFDLRVDLGDLPYGLRVDDVRVQADGVVVSAVAVGPVLSAPQALPCQACSPPSPPRS